jgi:hypothetical protein
MLCNTKVSTFRRNIFIFKIFSRNLTGKKQDLNYKQKHFFFSIKAEGGSMKITQLSK